MGIRHEEDMGSYREKIKSLVRENVDNFCGLMDAVDNPPAIDYSVEKDGVKIRIIGEITGVAHKISARDLL